MDAKSVRQFFRDLFGSRYIMQLETDLLRLRQDLEERLRDKDQIIADLRAEKAALQGKIIVYENSLLPLASKAGADVVAATKPKPKPNWGITFGEPPMMTNWQKIQADWEKHQDELDKAVAAAATGQPAPVPTEG